MRKRTRGLVQALSCPFPVLAHGNVFGRDAACVQPDSALFSAPIVAGHLQGQDWRTNRNGRRTERACACPSGVHQRNRSAPLVHELRTRTQICQRKIFDPFILEGERGPGTRGLRSSRGRCWWNRRAGRAKFDLALLPLGPPDRDWGASPSLQEDLRSSESVGSDGEGAPSFRRPGLSGPVGAPQGRRATAERG